MGKRKWTNEQLIKAVKSNLSYVGVLSELGLKPAGGNYDTIKRIIEELKLDTSHMTGQAWNQGERFHPVIQARKLSETLVKDSTWISIDKLRKRLIKEGFKEHKCEYCSNTE